MINTALSSFGAQIVLATSSDENHPPENMIDGPTVSIRGHRFFQKQLHVHRQNFIYKIKNAHQGKVWVSGGLKGEPIRKTDTFWLSTGLFPQEIIIRFPDNMKISIVSIHSLNVKQMRIEKSTLQEPDKFEMMAENEFECTEGSLQINDISLDGSNATHLRFVFLSGYDHFVSVHKVGVQA